MTVKMADIKTALDRINLSSTSAVCISNFNANAEIKLPKTSCKFTVALEKPNHSKRALSGTGRSVLVTSSQKHQIIYRVFSKRSNSLGSIKVLKDKRCTAVLQII